MRIFKSNEFIKFAKKEKISDAKLCMSIKDAEKGKIDADYGGGVIKQRIVRPNEGKSGGYRVISMFRQGDKAFFVHGFAQNEKESLSKQEVRLYKEAAKIVLAYSDAELSRYVSRGVFKEITYHD